MDSSCVDHVTLFLSRVGLEGSVALFFPVCYIGPLGLNCSARWAVQNIWPRKMVRSSVGAILGSE